MTRAELSGTRLRVEGTASANAAISVDGTVLGKSDAAGAFSIQKDPFQSPSCSITVSDGLTSATATLSGCTPSAPPPAPPAPAPATIAPGSGAQLTQPITLSWSSVTAATPIIGYNWQISTSSTFPPASVTAWGTTWYPAQGTPPPTQEMVSGLPNGAYFWRVNAVRAGATAIDGPVTGAWSAGSSFTITGSAPGTPGAPTITGPAQNSKFHPYEYFTVTWSAVPGAAYYLVDESTDSTFSFAQTSAVMGIQVTGALLRQLIGYEVGLYYRVRAVNSSGVRGLPAPAVHVTITYLAPIPPPPTLVAPASGTPVTLPVTFDWTDDANSQIGGYELQIANNSSFTGDCGTVELCVRSITPSEYTVPSLSAGTKYWRVRSWHGDASPAAAAVTAWSAVRSITVPATAAALLSFTIDVYGGGGTVLRSHTEAFSGTTADNLAYGKVQLSGPAPAGGAVVTLTSSDPNVASLPPSVTIPVGDAIAGFRIEPLQVTLSTTVTLTAAFDAKSVGAPFTVVPSSLKRLDLGAGPPVPNNFSGGATEPGSLLFNGLAPSGSVIALASSSPLVTVPSSITIGPTTPGSFAITTGQVLVPTTVTLTATWRGASVQTSLTLYPPPTLVSPPSGTTVATGQTVNFDWNDVAGGFSYEIQIDDASAFTAPLLVSASTSTLSGYSSSTLPGGTLFWRVRAHDVYGDPGPWSEVRTLTVTAPAGPLPAPTPMFPMSNARLSAGQTVVFMWSNVAGANSYTLQVDDASTFGSPFVLNQTVVGSNQYPTSTLPRLKMWWRVRANDVAGNPGTWSAVWQLEVK